MTKAPEPAADVNKDTEKFEAPPKDEEQKADTGKKGSRLAMTLREAEVIAQNLKGSGTRR